MKELKSRTEAKRSAEKARIEDVVFKYLVAILPNQDYNQRMRVMYRIIGKPYECDIHDHIKREVEEYQQTDRTLSLLLELVS